MRLFVGIPLAAAVVNELSAVSLRLRSSGDGFRWSAPDSWHITPQFLGNTDQERYVCAAARLRELRLPPVPIRLEGLGFFDRTGILFAGVKVSSELLLLHERVGEATALCGFIPETRPFRPHITLARSKGKGKRDVPRELRSEIGKRRNFTEFVAGEFLLYESFLGPAGSRYEVRERFSLGSR
jgi:2'-5' RNA ligase